MVFLHFGLPYQPWGETAIKTPTHLYEHGWGFDCLTWLIGLTRHVNKVMTDDTADVYGTGWLVRVCALFQMIMSFILYKVSENQKNGFSQW